MSGGQRVAEFCLRGSRLSQDELERYFQALLQGFLDGDLELLAKRFDTPLVVYSVSGVVVLQTVEDIVQRMKMYRDALLSLTALSGRFELISEDSLVNNRLRVTVRAVYFGRDGEEVTENLAQYFLVRRDDALIVEMIEYLDTVGSPEEAKQTSVH